MTKEAVLKDYPGIPGDALLAYFLFLWDDPLFTYKSSIDDWELTDPELIVERRKLTLKCVEALYLKIASQERELAKEKEEHQEACAREVWVLNQFLKHLPCETTQRIVIDLQVNDMDVDFSFKKAIGIHTNQTA